MGHSICVAGIHCIGSAHQAVQSHQRAIVAQIARQPIAVIERKVSAYTMNHSMLEVRLCSCRQIEGPMLTLSYAD